MNEEISKPAEDERFQELQSKVDIKREELRIKQEHLDLEKKQSASRKFLIPTYLGLFAASLTAITSVVSTALNNRTALQVEQERVRGSLRVERERVQGGLLIEAIKTGSPEQSLRILRMLNELELVSIRPELIQQWQLNPETTPFLPAPTSSPIRLSVPQVHLPPRAHTPADTNGLAFPLGGVNMPTRADGTDQERVESIFRIIEYLNVEQSGRYQAGPDKNLSNIYAYDYAYLAGAYLPRVWWTKDAIRSILAGNIPEIRYGTTVMEINENGLFGWLEDFGSEFGWERVLSLNELQDAANGGAVALIVAKAIDMNKSGHISIIVPETPTLQAVRISGIVIRPVQSQAGFVNFRFDVPSQNWWLDSNYSAFAYWIAR